MKKSINVNKLIEQNKIVLNLNCNIPTVLHELRWGCGKTMEDVVEDSGISLSTLKRKLNNESPIKSTEELIDLCTAMELDIITTHAICHRFTEGRYLTDKVCIEKLREYMKSFYEKTEGVRI